MNASPVTSQQLEAMSLRADAAGQPKLGSILMTLAVALDDPEDLTEIFVTTAEFVARVRGMTLEELFTSDAVRPIVPGTDL